SFYLAIEHPKWYQYPQTKTWVANDRLTQNPPVSFSRESTGVNVRECADDGSGNGRPDLP
ncbi:MAG: hypothetical protein ABSF38_05595, partial [Verrucomicrobiota bacterium]